MEDGKEQSNVFQGHQIPTLPQKSADMPMINVAAKEQPFVEQTKAPEVVENSMVAKVSTIQNGKKELPIIASTQKNTEALEISSTREPQSFSSGVSEASNISLKPIGLVSANLVNRNGEGGASTLQSQQTFGTSVGALEKSRASDQMIATNIDEANYVKNSGFMPGLTNIHTIQPPSTVPKLQNQLVSNTPSMPNQAQQGQASLLSSQPVHAGLNSFNPPNAQKDSAGASVHSNLHGRTDWARPSSTFLFEQRQTNSPQMQTIPSSTLSSSSEQQISSVPRHPIPFQQNHPFPSMPESRQDAISTSQGPVSTKQSNQLTNGTAKQWSIKVTMKGKSIDDNPDVAMTHSAFSSSSSQNGIQNPVEGGVAGPPKKRKSGGPKHKSYPDMIIETLLDFKDRKGASLQGLKKHILEEYKVESIRFNQHISMAIKKMLKSGELEKYGVRYKLEAKLYAKKRPAFIRKKEKAAELAYRKKVKAGLITEEEIALKKAEEEAAEKRKAEKIEREKLKAEEKARERALELENLEAIAEPIRERKNLPHPFQPLANLPFKCNVDGLLSIAEFCKEHALILKLQDFTADMLYNALTANFVSSLLREIHLVLLGLCLEPEMDQDELVTRWDWFKTLNSLTWQEILRRYLLRTAHVLGEDFIFHKHLVQACEHLASKPYVTLTLDAKIAALCILIDDVTSHPEVIESIDATMKLRDDLEKNKNEELRQDWAETRKLKAMKKYLDQGVYVPNSVSGEKTSKKGRPTKEELKELKSANAKALKEVEERKERNAIKFEDEMLQYRLRPEPWGTDSRGNTYYSFDCDVKRFYICGFGLRGETPHKQKLWRYYNSVDHIDQLIKSCDSKSKREKALRANLERYYDQITKHLIPSAAKSVSSTSKTEQQENLQEQEKESVSESSSESEQKASRPTRGAAKVATDRIRAKKENANGADSEDINVKREPRKKSWDDFDEDAFDKYQNILNYVEGLELDLDNPTEEQQQAGLDDPDVKHFKDAERMAITARVLRKDLCELCRFLSDRGGNFSGENGLDKFQSQIEKVLSDNKMGVSRAPSINDIKQEGLTKKTSRPTIESVTVPKSSREELQAMCVELERVAVEAIISSKQRNVSRELERKERLRRERAQKRKEAQERAKQSKSAIAREQRNAWRQAKSNSSSMKRKRPNSSKGPRGKRSKSGEEGYTQSGRATRRVNYNVNAMYAAGGEDEDTDTESETESEIEEDVISNGDDDGVDKQSGNHDDEEEQEEEQARAAAALDENDKDTNDEQEMFVVSKNDVINEDIDVPKEEANRIEILQKFENLFPRDTRIRASGPNGEVNGTVLSYTPASFLTPDLVEDLWSVKLDNDILVYMNQSAMTLAIERLARYERDLAAIQVKVDIPDTIKEPSGISNVEAPKVLEEVRVNIKVLWGTKSERDAWFHSAELAVTCAAWASVVYQLANRIYVNNSLKDDESHSS